MKTYFSNIKNRLSFSYQSMVMICFIQIAFLTALIVFSSLHILQHYQAAAFIKQVNVIPIAYTRIPFYTGGSFILLMIIARLRSLLSETLANTILLLFCEILVCIFMMWSLSFSSNDILLLVIANMVALTRKRENRGVSLAIYTLLYLFTNTNVISNFIPVTSLDAYLSIYTSQAASLFLGIKNILTTLCIICFIANMLFLIQDQLDESQKIQLLNEELQNLNEDLKEYADVREKMGETRERNRLAREIHDTLGHTLTGLSTGLEACATLIDIDHEMAKKQLAVLSNVARDGLKDVRHSVNKLRPDALQKKTLKEALAGMINEFHESSGVSVYFACHLSSLEFQQDEEDTIYRIVQEGMTNAVRHGLATEIYISFAMDLTNLVIIIEDNGIGCKQITEGFGLHHMKERVALLQGKLRVYGTEGFVLIVELPIRKEETHDTSNDC